jgi:hypothetical protein
MEESATTRMRRLLEGVRAAATAAAFFEEAGTAVLTVVHGVAGSFIRTLKASLRRSCVPIRRVTGSASASLPRRPTPLEIIYAIAPLLTQSPRRWSSTPPAESSRQWGSSRTACVFRISGPCGRSHGVLVTVPSIRLHAPPPPISAKRKQHPHPRPCRGELDNETEAKSASGTSLKFLRQCLNTINPSSPLPHNHGINLRMLVFGFQFEFPWKM